MRPRGASGASIALIALLLGAGCMGPAEPNGPQDGQGPPAAASYCAVDGRVVDDEHRPLALAQVHLVGAMAAVSTSTDALGRFEFSGLEPGPLRATAAKIGYYEANLAFTCVAGKVVELLLPLRKVPIADPPYDWTDHFEGTLVVGATAPQGSYVVGQGVDGVDFSVTMLAEDADGVEVAPIRTLIELAPGPDSVAGLDLDLQLIDPDGRVVENGTGDGPYGTIDSDTVWAPGVYTVRVILWAGAAADFTVDVAITYAQGEQAQYARRYG